LFMRVVAHPIQFTSKSHKIHSGLKDCHRSNTILNFEKMSQLILTVDTSCSKLTRQVPPRAIQRVISSHQIYVCPVVYHCLDTRGQSLRFIPDFVTASRNHLQGTPRVTSPREQSVVLRKNQYKLQACIRASQYPPSINCFHACYDRYWYRPGPRLRIM